MPIIDGHVEYEIPPEIDERIPDYFYIAMAGELCSVFGIDIFIKDEDDNYPLFYVSSTGGWYEALKATCKKLDMKWFLDYWVTLEWYDSDVLDGYIEDRIIEEFIDNRDSRPNCYYKYLVSINV